MKRFLLVTTAVVGMCAFGELGFAATASDTGTGNGTASTTMSVDAYVAVACTVDASGGLAFGTSGSPLSATTINSSGATSSATVTANCDGVPSITPYITVDLGGNSSGSGRRLQNGGSYLNYTIASTSGGADLGVSDQAGFSSAASGTSTLTLYGAIASGQTATAGHYNDTVNISLYY